MAAELFLSLDCGSASHFNPHFTMGIEEGVSMSSYFFFLETLVVIRNLIFRYCSSTNFRGQVVIASNPFIITS